MVRDCPIARPRSEQLRRFLRRRRGGLVGGGRRSLHLVSVTYRSVGKASPASVSRHMQISWISGRCRRTSRDVAIGRTQPSLRDDGSYRPSRRGQPLLRLARLATTAAAASFTPARRDHGAGGGLVCLRFRLGTANAADSSAPLVRASGAARRR